MSRHLLRKWGIFQEIIRLGIGLSIITFGTVVEGSSMNYSVNPYAVDELAVSEIQMLEYLIQKADDEQLDVNSELGKTIET